LVVPDVCVEWWDKWAPRLKDVFHLHTWHIKVYWETLEECCIAECAADPDYHRASITIDPMKIVDEDHFIHVLRHEMLHIFHAETQLVRRQWERLLGRKDSRVLREALDHASERLVYRIERMFDLGLRMSPRELAEKGELDEEGPIVPSSTTE